MTITLNGAPREIPDGARLSDLLSLLGLSSERVAVELNRALVRRGDHARTELAPDDRIEIVTLVGGG